MKRPALILLLPALAFLAGCSTGPRHQPRWDPNAKPRDENWHSPAAALLKYDLNHDGTLTRDELKAGLKAEFDTYDVGHHNCIGPDQARAINQLRVKEDASEATPLVDWNQDGCIDFNEYSGTALSLFDTLDVNRDGRLSADELRPAGTGRKPGQGPSGGRGGRHHGGPSDGGPGQSGGDGD
ncbi:MAG: hypothetical protein JSR60_10130 [Proteobacteria bacterium]|nr:hypothetical protein [Pseudomonadota bacterium]